MAKKKPQVPRPPSNVQAPKRRDAPRSGPSLSLAGMPRWAWGAGGGVIVVVVAVLGYVLLSGGSSVPTSPVSVLGKLTPAPAAGKLGPEQEPIPAAKALAPAGWLNLGQTRDGINCDPIENLAYHIHVHLTIFVNGTQRLVPYGIGIAPPRQGQKLPGGYFVGSGSCFAWLHTHASDGIIHVESPSEKTYTLGDFFDIWGVQLGPAIVGPARGHVTAFYNGKYYKGSPRNLPLKPHAQIQLDVGKPLIAPETIVFRNGL